MAHEREVKAALEVYHSSVMKLYQSREDTQEEAAVSANEARSAVEAAQDRFYRHRMEKSCANTTTA
jgi:hypothetical protein